MLNRNALWILSWWLDAWVYHNAQLWLISISYDMETWMTIADKNLWATQVYNPWDVLSQDNCWYFYQWWNNYWFPFTWPTSTSSTKVNASWYWPWNYYSSSTFIIWDSYTDTWMTSSNTNLWWNDTWTASAMQWPCPNWFHVMWYDDLQQFASILVPLWLMFWSATSSVTSPALLMPLSWVLDNTWTPVAQWEWIYYNSWSGISLWVQVSSIFTLWNYWVWTDSAWPILWCNIRPLKDTPVVPDLQWTKLY